MAASKFKSTFKQASSQISTIFFDMDNTLIATRKGDAKACNKVSYLMCLYYMMCAHALESIHLWGVIHILCKWFKCVECSWSFGWITYDVNAPPSNTKICLGIFEYIRRLHNTPTHRASVYIFGIHFRFYRSI